MLSMLCFAANPPGLHTFFKDPDKAPDIARRSYLMKKRFMPQAKIIGPSVATSSTVAAATPRPLPSHTIRRHLRTPFRISTGKCTMYAKPHGRIRKVSYKPLPEGWQWPPVPGYRSLPYHKLKKKRKKCIPQEALDEWRLFTNRTQASSLSSSSSASPPQPSRWTEAREPRTGELDSDITMGEDSADDEAFTCLDPFEHDWDESNLGLDDLH